MVSLDSPEKNAAFAESLETSQVLLSDPTGSTAKAYGVTSMMRPFPRRWTFYIDREGILRRVDRDVSASSAGQDIARQLAELGFPKRTP